MPTPVNITHADFGHIAEWELHVNIFYSTYILLWEFLYDKSQSQYLFISANTVEHEENHSRH